MTTTTSPSRWVGDDGKGHVPSATAQSSEAGPHSLDVFALDSCHSTWIFDPRRLRFRRILKGVAFKGRPVFTQWRPYSQLQLDFEGEGFTVYLNPARTRLIRSWRAHSGLQPVRRFGIDCAAAGRCSLLDPWTSESGR